MLVTKDSISSLSNLEYFWENSDYFFCWKGVIFFKGIPCGMDSIKAFSKEVKSMGLQEAVRILKGNYFIVIKDKRCNMYYSFIDNSGLFQAFFSDRNIISTSFLELAKSVGMSKSDLDREAIVEFIHFGAIFFKKTFFYSIRKITSKQILAFSEKGKVRFLTKQIPDLDVKGNGFSFFDFFEGLVSSIKNEKVSVDLTGGIDSRLLAVLLDYFGLEFETAVSAVSGSRDIEIAKIVASILKHDIYVTCCSADNLEDGLQEAFTMCDGLCNILKSYSQLRDNKGRLGRGVDLKLTGLGGELYKDFWWLQDFPFYSRQKSNLEKLFNYRIAPIDFKHFYFSGDYEEISRNLKQKVLRELSTYVMETNTNTYDNIYFNYKMQEVAGRSITSDYSLLKSYAPLLELDLVRYGFTMARKARVFNNFHRKTITSIAPDVAKVQTTERGVSVSSKNIDIIQDIYKYLMDKGIRLTTKVGQKLLKRTYFKESSFDPNLNNKARGLQITNDCIELLKDEGIINKRLNLRNIDNNHIGNIISLALLMRHLN